MCGNCKKSCEAKSACSSLLQSATQLSAGANATMPPPVQEEVAKVVTSTLMHAQAPLKDTLEALWFHTSDKGKPEPDWFSSVMAVPVTSY